MALLEQDSEDEFVSRVFYKFGVAWSLSIILVYIAVEIGIEKRIHDLWFTLGLMFMFASIAIDILSTLVTKKKMSRLLGVS